MVKGHVFILGWLSRILGPIFVGHRSRIPTQIKAWKTLVLLPNNQVRLFLNLIYIMGTVLPVMRKTNRIEAGCPN